MRFVGPLLAVEIHRRVADEPPEQQVVVQLFHQHAFAANRVQHVQQKRPQKLRVQSVELRRQLFQCPAGLSREGRNPVRSCSASGELRDS